LDEVILITIGQMPTLGSHLHKVYLI